MPGEGEISSVAIKLPTFWPNRAQVWFAQAEAQFVTRHVTQDATKYAYIVAALDQDTATRVLDILQDPPDADKYKVLKDRLLQTFTLSESERAARLLNMPGLGDGKPSELMDKMLALMPTGKQPDFLFREIFMQQLPSDVRSHLIQADIENFRELAKAADKLCVGPESSINAVRRLPRQTTPTSSYRPKHAPIDTSNTPGPCFYHRKFGNAARQCRPPCNFSAAENFQAGRQ